MRRDQLAAIREQCVETSHLERRDEQVLLADRELHRVAGLPQPVDLPGLRIPLLRVRLAPPLRCGQEAGRLTAHVQPCRLPETERRGPLLERAAVLRREAVELEAQLVEVGVARGSERGRQVHRLVHVRVPVPEGRPVDLHLPRAGQRLVRPHQLLAHRSEGSDRLERRARRVEAGRRAVQAGVVGLLGSLGIDQRPELRRLRLAHVDPRVVRGVGRHRADRSGARVDRDCGSGVRVPALVLAGDLDAVLERVLGRALQLRVERRPQREARLRLLAPQWLRARAPHRVHAQLGQAGRPAEEAVVGELEACLADGIPVAVAAGLQLILRHVSHMAEDLRRERPVPVVAEVDVVQLEAGEVPSVLLEVEDLLLAEILFQRHRREWIALVLAQQPPELRHRDDQDRREPAQHPLPAAARHVRRPDLSGGADPVRDEQAALVVEDRPTRRVDPDRAQLVVLRGGEVLVAGEHLERPESEEEHGEREEDDRAEHAEPERHRRRHPVRLLHSRVARHEAGPRRDTGDRSH